MRAAAKAEIAAVRHAVDHQRKIVFTSSVAALTGNPGQANYTAAKGALIALAKTLAHGARSVRASRSTSWHPASSRPG